MTQTAPENIIARVVTTENQFAKAVEQAEAANSLRVQEHKKELEQIKAAHKKKVREERDQQLSAATEKACREVAEKLRLLEDGWSKLNNDGDLLAAARHKIAEIILRE